MENRKQKFLAIAFIAIMTMTTGCGITITRNHYYATLDLNVSTSNKRGVQVECPGDSLTNNENGQN